MDNAYLIKEIRSIVHYAGGQTKLDVLIGCCLPFPSMRTHMLALVVCWRSSSRVTILADIVTGMTRHREKRRGEKW